MALTNQYFYHSSIRNTIIAFGSLFNEIHISRQDDTQTEIQKLKVPLYYGGKSKALSIVMGKPDIEERNFKLGLPAMSFQISGFQRDLSRKMNNTDTIRGTGVGSNVSYVHNSAPYDMELQMTIASKNIDDVLQIIEQIMPFFNPNYSIKINYVPEIGIVRDLHITLDSIDWSDNYEEEISVDRIIIATLSFNTKLNFFGPVSTSGIIKDASVSISETTGATIDNVHVYVNPANAGPTDNWTFVTEFLSQ